MYVDIVSVLLIRKFTVNQQMYKCFTITLLHEKIRILCH